MGVWVCGCVGVWVCGCVGVWVCECVGVCVCACGCGGCRHLGPGYMQGQEQPERQGRQLIGQLLGIGETAPVKAHSLAQLRRGRSELLAGTRGSGGAGAANV